MPKQNRTEKLEFKIYECGKDRWEIYSKHHYLTNSLATNSKCYEITINQKPVGFIAMRKFMHPIVKNMFMISRVVILPEYQGFGLAIKFMKIISQKYIDLGNQVRIVTSLKPFINSLKNNKNFKLLRFDRIGSGNKKQKSTSHNRITGSFEYIGDKNA